MGCDRKEWTDPDCWENFNSHTPCGVRPIMYIVKYYMVLRFQLTHPMWGATCDRCGFSVGALAISTHTPHVGCDPFSPDRYIGLIQDFNSHTPCGVRLFHCYTVFIWWENFNSHTPCGVRPSMPLISPFATKISTHTPHVGCD